MDDRHDSPDEQDQSQVPIVLIDNNIIQHCMSKAAGDQVLSILEAIDRGGAQIGVSQIVVFEALKAIVFNNDKFDAVSKFFEKGIIRYPLDEDLLIEAARVHEIYGSEKGNHRQSISTEDVIIGTTAMLLGAYILTCDANDFPIPYFKETEREFIYYTEKGRRKHIIVYLLEPDTDAIEAALTNITNPKASVIKRIKAKVKK